MPKQLVALNEQREAGHAQRVAEALRLRADGNSLRDIAGKLNISVSTARDYWREALALLIEDTKQQAGEQRAVMLARLEELISKWSSMANLPHVEGADRAAAIVIRAMEGQARLLGLDKVDVGTGQLGEVDISEALKSKAARDALRRMLDEADRAAAILRLHRAGTSEPPRRVFG